MGIWDIYRSPTPVPLAAPWRIARWSWRQGRSLRHEPPEITHETTIKYGSSCEITQNSQIWYEWYDPWCWYLMNLNHTTIYIYNVCTVYVCMYIYICTYVYMYICICIYIYPPTPAGARGSASGITGFCLCNSGNKDDNNNNNQPTSQPASQPTNQQTTNKQPTTNSQHPTANNQQPTSNSQQPTTNNQQPTTINHQPSTTTTTTTTTTTSTATATATTTTTTTTTTAATTTPSAAAAAARRACWLQAVVKSSKDEMPTFQLKNSLVLVRFQKGR